MYYPFALFLQVSYFFRMDVRYAKFSLNGKGSVISLLIVKATLCELVDVVEVVFHVAKDGLVHVGLGFVHVDLGCSLAMEAMSF